MHYILVHSANSIQRWTTIRQRGVQVRFVRGCGNLRQWEGVGLVSSNWHKSALHTIAAPCKGTPRPGHRSCLHHGTKPVVRTGPKLMETSTKSTLTGRTARKESRGGNLIVGIGRVGVPERDQFFRRLPDVLGVFDDSVEVLPHVFNQVGVFLEVDAEPAVQRYFGCEAAPIIDVHGPPFLEIKRQRFQYIGERLLALALALPRISHHQVDQLRCRHRSPRRNPGTVLHYRLDLRSHTKLLLRHVKSTAHGKAVRHRLSATTLPNAFSLQLLSVDNSPCGGSYSVYPGKCRFTNCGWPMCRSRICTASGAPLGVRSLWRRHVRAM